MGNCCTKTLNEDSHMDLDKSNFNNYNEFNKDNIEVQNSRKDIHNQALNNSFTSDNDHGIESISYKRLEQEKNRKFCQDLLNELNLIRNKPLQYIKKLEYFKEQVKEVDNNRYILEYEGIITPLSNKYIFDELINLIRSNESLQVLEMKDNLVITLPSDINLIQSYDYMANQFVMKKLGLSNIYKNLMFHYDVNNRNAELSTLFQLIDDSNVNKQRRRNILNRSYSCIGISIERISKENFCSYIVFGETY